MAEINSNDNLVGRLLFNSNLETGIRTLIVLNAAYPMPFDLTRLTWLDHLVVHTGDINGPKSLHPNLPQRNGEMLVRRRLIEDGITLMRRLNLIEAIPSEHGISYRATDEAYPFVQLMRAKYSLELKNRAEWLVENVCKLNKDDIQNLIAEKLGIWNVEFQEKIELHKGST